MRNVYSADLAFLHVTPRTSLGGFERFTSDLGSALGSIGLRVSYIEVDSRLAAAAYRLAGNRHFHSGHTGLRFGEARSALRSAACVYVKNEMLDLCVLRALAPKSPAIVGVHTSIRNCGAQRGLRIRNRLYRSAIYRSLLSGPARTFHVLDATSESATLIRDWFPTSRISVIPNPLPAITAGTLGPPDPMRFLFAGRLTYQKGADLIRAAWPIFVRQHAGVSLDVAGDGPYGPALEAESTLEFRGRIQATAAVSANAGWLLLPSRWEEQPLILLERLALGLPYIVGTASSLSTFSLSPAFTLHTATPAGLVQALHNALLTSSAPTDFRAMCEIVSRRAERWPSAQSLAEAVAKLVADTQALC